MATINPFNSNVNFRGIGTSKPLSREDRDKIEREVAEERKRTTIYPDLKVRTSDDIDPSKLHQGYLLQGRLINNGDEKFIIHSDIMNITNDQKLLLSKRAQNGLNIKVAEQICKLPSQCAAMFLASDDEGNYYVPTGILNKLGKEGYTLVPVIVNGKALDSGDTKIMKNGKQVGLIKTNLSKTFKENDTKNISVKMRNSEFVTTDVNSEDIPIPATFTYTVDTGLIDIRKSGLLYELPENEFFFNIQ